MSSWGLSSSDNNSGGQSKQKSSVNPNNDHLLLLDVDDVELQIKEAEAETEEGGKNKTTSSRRSRGKMSITAAGEAGKKANKDGESDDHEMHIWTERERRKKMRNMFATLHSLLPHLPPKADKSTIVDEAVNYIKSLQTTLQKLQKQKLERLQQIQSASTTFGYDPSQWHHPYDQSSREAFIADQGSNTINNNNSSTNNNNNISNNLVAITNNAVNMIGTSNPSTSLLSAPRIDSSSNNNNNDNYNNNPVGFQTWTSPNLVLNICGDEAQFSVCSSKKPGLFTSICFVLEKHKIVVLSAHLSSDSNRSIYLIQAQVNRASNQLPEAYPVEEIFKQAAAEIILWLS